METKTKTKDKRTNNLNYVLNDAEQGVNHNTGHFRFVTGIDVWFSDYHPYKTKEDAASIVKLIAAAPELLQALEMIKGRIEDLADAAPREHFNWYTKGLANQLESAIKKATE